MTPQLVVLAKAPVIGGAKTRLAAGIGKVQAWRIYRMMTAKIIRQVVDPRWETVLAISPDEALDRRFLGVWPDDVTRTRQGAGDLGDRQARVFSRRGPTIVIGTDTPTVTRSDIDEAFKALRSHDAVIGPAVDGGYWLLGLNGPAPQGLFEGIRWSHEETKKDLKMSIQAAGLKKQYELKKRRDVDRKSDFNLITRQGVPSD